MWCISVLFSVRLIFLEFLSLAGGICLERVLVDGWYFFSILFVGGFRFGILRLLFVAMGQSFQFFVLLVVVSGI